MSLSASKVTYPQDKPDRKEYDNLFRSKFSEHEIDPREVSRLRRQLNEADDQINRINGQLLQVQGGAKELENQNGLLNKELSRLNELRYQSELDNKLKTQELIEVRQKLEHQNMIHASTEKTLKESLHECGNLQQELMATKKALYSEAEQRKKVEDDMRKLHQEYEKLKRKRDGDITKYKQALEEIKDQSTKKIVKFKDRIKDSHLISSAQKDQIEELKDVIKEQEQQLQMIQQQHQQQIAQREKYYSTEIEMVVNRVAKENVQHMEQLKQHFQMQADEKINVINETKRELLVSQDKSQNLEQEVSRLRMQHKQLQQSLNDRDDQLQYKQEVISRLQSQENQSLSVMRQKDDTIGALQEELRGFDTQMREFKFQVDQNGQLINQLQQENFQLVSAKQDCDQENKRFKELIQRLQVLFGIEPRLSISLADLERLCRKILNENSTQQQQLHDLTNDHQELSRKLNYYVQKDEENQQNVMTLQDNLLKIEQQFSSLQRDHQRILSQSQEEVQRRRLEETETHRQLEQSMLQIRQLHQTQAELEQQNKRLLSDLENQPSKDIAFRVQQALGMELRLSAKAEDVDKHLRKLINDKQSLQQQLDEAVLDLEDTRAKLSLVSAKEDEASLNALKLQEKLLRVEKQLSNAQKDHQRAAAQLHEEISKKNQDRMQLQQQLDENSHQIKVMVNTQSDLEQRGKRQQQEITTLKEKNNELATALSKQRSLQSQIEGQALLSQEKLAEQALKEVELSKKESIQNQIDNRRKQERIEHLEEQLDLLMRQHEQQLQQSQSEIQHMTHQLEHLKTAQRDKLHAQHEYDQIIRDVQRKADEQITEIKEQYEARIYNLKQQLVESRVSPEKIRETRLGSGFGIESSTKFYSPVLKLSRTEVRPSRPEGELRKSSQTLEDNNPERTIEELRQEIQQQKSKLSRMSLNFSESQKSFSQNKRVQFQGTPELVERMKPLYATTSKRELTSTFNQMKLRD